MEKPFEILNFTYEEYRQHAEFMARRIAARVPAAPAAVLSNEALHLLQCSALAPFWRESLSGTPKGKPEAINAKYLKESSRAALDLRIGSEMLILDLGKKSSFEYKSLAPNIDISLPPKNFAIIKSLEYLCMPPFLVGLIVTPVTTAMSAISNIATMIDPFFEGYLLLNFYNFSEWSTITLKLEMVVSRVVFHMVAEFGEPQVVEPYRYGVGGKYSLKEIIEKRVKAAEEKFRAYSPEIMSGLREWLLK